tara:strand:+ start:2002 stop:2268 length:267 start_codon:yes stop_codon:yes gene_type:complete
MYNDYYKDRLLLNQYKVGDIVQLDGSSVKVSQHGLGQILSISEEQCSVKIKWQGVGEKWYSPRTIKKVDTNKISFNKRVYERLYSEEN